MLGGKPLIVWSIDQAKGIRKICDILVSTDDPEIARISKEAGALVPWLRPKNLATDTASSVDVALHALNWYESNKSKVDGVILLQPTSPFRKKSTIRKAIDLFRNNKKYPVISVSPVPTPPHWMMIKQGRFCEPFCGIRGLSMRSQDLPVFYQVNGVIYLCPANILKKSKHLIMKRNTPLLIQNSAESLDIDTKEDWAAAQQLVAQARF